MSLTKTESLRRENKSSSKLFIGKTMAYLDTAARKRRFVFLNSREKYEDILRRKRIRSIKQYSTISFNISSLENSNTIKEVVHIWKTGDRYYKLANRYYGRPNLWWVIALYNKKPTEGHLRRGDILRIPAPIDIVLYYL